MMTGSPELELCVRSHVLGGLHAAGRKDAHAALLLMALRRHDRGAMCCRGKCAHSDLAVIGCECCTCRPAVRLRKAHASDTRRS